MKRKAFSCYMVLISTVLFGCIERTVASALVSGQVLGEGWEIRSLEGTVADKILFNLIEWTTESE
jgi:hypothetical protein